MDVCLSSTLHLVPSWGQTKPWQGSMQWHSMQAVRSSRYCETPYWQRVRASWQRASDSWSSANRTGFSLRRGSCTAAQGPRASARSTHAPELQRHGRIYQGLLKPRTVSKLDAIPAYASASKVIGFVKAKKGSHPKALLRNLPLSCLGLAGAYKSMENGELDVKWGHTPHLIQRETLPRRLQRVGLLSGPSRTPSWPARSSPCKSETLWIDSCEAEISSGYLGSRVWALMANTVESGDDGDPDAFSSSVQKASIVVVAKSLRLKIF